MLKFRDYFNLRFEAKWEPYARFTYVDNEAIVGTIYNGTQYWRFGTRSDIILFEIVNPDSLADTHNHLPFTLWILGVFKGWNNA